MQIISCLQMSHSSRVSEENEESRNTSKSLDTPPNLVVSEASLFDPSLLPYTPSVTMSSFGTESAVDFSYLAYRDNSDQFDSASSTSSTATEYFSVDEDSLSLDFIDLSQLDDVFSDRLQQQCHHQLNHQNQQLNQQLNQQNQQQNQNLALDFALDDLKTPTRENVKIAALFEMASAQMSSFESDVDLRRSFENNSSLQRDLLGDTDLRSQTESSGVSACNSGSFPYSSSSSFNSSFTPSSTSSFSSSFSSTHPSSFSSQCSSYSSLERQFTANQPKSLELSLNASCWRSIPQGNRQEQRSRVPSRSMIKEDVERRKIAKSTDLTVNQVSFKRKTSGSYFIERPLSASDFDGDVTSDMSSVITSSDDEEDAREGGSSERSDQKPKKRRRKRISYAAKARTLQQKADELIADNENCKQMIDQMMSEISICKKMLEKTFVDQAAKPK